MVGKLRGQLSFLGFAIETPLAQGKVFLRAVAADATRNGVFNVVERILSQEIGHADLVARIEANVVLLFPKLEFEDVVVGGLLRRALLLIELQYFLLILLSVVVERFLIVGNGLALVGIIEFSRIFHMNFGGVVDDALLQQLVDDLSKFVQGAHGHRVSDGAHTRGT